MTGRKYVIVDSTKIKLRSNVVYNKVVADYLASKLLDCEVYLLVKVEPKRVITTSHQLMDLDDGQLLRANDGELFKVDKYKSEVDGKVSTWLLRFGDEYGDVFIEGMEDRSLESPLTIVHIAETED